MFLSKKVTVLVLFEHRVKVMNNLFIREFFITTMPYPILIKPKNGLFLGNNHYWFLFVCHDRIPSAVIVGAYPLIKRGSHNFKFV